MFPGFQNFPEGQIIGFALIFLRLIAFVVAWPVFGSPMVSSPVKVLLALVFTVLIFPTVKFSQAELITINDHLIFLSIREVIIGLLLGYIFRFFFFAISVAGEMVGVSSGLASAQLFNPASGAQTNVMEQVHIILATLFLLAMNGHHLFISGIAQSFEVIKVAAVGFEYKSFPQISLLIREIFEIGLKMAAPTIVAIFATNLTMGLLGRAVPQMNVMTTSFQVTIMVTIVVFMISLPLFVSEMDVLLSSMAEHFFKIMKVL